MHNKTYTDAPTSRRAARQRLSIRPISNLDRPNEVTFQIDDEKISVRLEPCPHCGGSAEYRIIDNNADGTENHFIQCKNCLASTMRVTVSALVDDENIYGTIKTTINNIVENWNSRYK